MGVTASSIHGTQVPWMRNPATGAARTGRDAGYLECTSACTEPAAADPNGAREVRLQARVAIWYSPFRDYDGY